MNIRNTIIYSSLFCIVAFALSFQAAANVATAEYSSMPAMDCVINPYRVVDISSPVAGIIEKLYVERSQKVSAGEMVAQLEASVERADVALAKYRTGIQSEVGLGQVNISFDMARKKRVDTLLEKQNISKENADQIEREVQLSRWKLRQAKELLDIRKLELHRAEEQLKQKSIRAPFDGFVLDTFKYRGEYVEEQPILRLVQLDPLVIETIVPMEYFGTIKVGMLAEIRPEVLFKEKLMGTVTAVDRIGDTASNTFGIKLSTPNPDNHIPAGLKCIVKFIAQTPKQIAENKQAQISPETTAGHAGRTKLPPDQQDSVAKKSNNAEADSRESLASLSDESVSEAPLLDPIEADGQRHNVTKKSVVLVKAQGEVDRPSSTEKIPSSYMVLMEQPETDQATRKLISRLRNAGVHDLQELNYGTNKEVISLGIFNKRAYAVNWQQKLGGLGFASFIIERYQ